MSLNDLKGEFGGDISSAVDDLSNSLPLSRPQLRKAYSDEELKKLHSMIEEVNKATTENEKVAKLATHAKTAFGLLKKLGVGI